MVFRRCDTTLQELYISKGPIPF